MRRTTGVLVIGLALFSQASTVAALGFGRISNSTVLGQQLEFSVVVTTEGGEALSADCVKAEVSAGENILSSGVVRTRLDTPADGGPSTLRVITNVRIDEPVASINVTIGCPTRLARKFVVFIDPPVTAALPSVVAAAASGAAGGEAVASGVPDATVASAPLAPSRNAVPAEPVKPAASPKPRPRPAADRVPRVTEARPQRLAPVAPKRVAQLAQRSAAAGTAVAAATQAAPRLKLEAELPAYRPGPAASSVPGAALPPVAGAASMPGADSAVLANAEQLRIQLLEQNIQKLLTEARSTQASLAAMQARLREAESSRFSNSVVYALLGLIGLLLALLLLLLWRQSKLKREQAWWVAGVEGEAAAAAAAAPEAEPAAPAEPEPSERAPLIDSPPALPAMKVDQLRHLSNSAPQTFVVDGGPSAPSRDLLAAAPNEPARDMSVDELIDMEQQAEFFVVLGQDDAAIDLLMGHVRNGGTTSPLAFLKLLEIYRRRGEREPYDRVRERFNRRFNAYAPDWESGAAAGQALEDYPQVVAQLQAVWPDPAQAMALLEALLFRRDENAGTFDLPAYGELLFLYSQARDLADSDVSGGEVDLLLPLGEDFDFSLPKTTSPVPLDGLPASPPRQPPTIDFDLDFQLPDTPGRK